MSSSSIIKSVMSVLLALVLARGSGGELASSQIQNLEEWNLPQMKRKKNGKKIFKMQFPASFSTRYG